MKTSSAKAKGRRHQQDVAQRIRATFDLPESDVKSLPMGSQGCDVWMSAHAFDNFPFAIECKNQEAINIWAAFKQAEDNAKNSRGVEEGYPLVVFTRNRAAEPLATLRFSDLLKILKDRFG